MYEEKSGKKLRGGGEEAYLALRDRWGWVEYILVK